MPLLGIQEGLVVAHGIAAASQAAVTDTAETQAMATFSFDFNFHITGDPLLRMFRFWQVLMMAHALIFIASFFLQIYCERYQRHEIAPDNIKYLLHRMGLFSSFVLFAYSIDPFTIDGIYPELACYEMSTILTACLVTAVVILNHASHVVVKKSQFQQPSGFVKVVSYLVAAITFGSAVACPLLAYEHDDMWYSGIYVLWLGTAFLVCVSWFLWNTWTILQYFQKSQESESGDRGRSSSSGHQGGHRRGQSNVEYQAAKHEKKIKEMKWRMWFVVALTIIFVPTQYVMGSERILRGRGHAPFVFVDTDHGEPKDFFLLAGQLLAMWGMLWYSWVKVRFSKPKETWDEERDSSGSISSARRISKQDSKRLVARADSEISVSRADTEHLLEDTLEPPEFEHA